MYPLLIFSNIPLQQLSKGTISPFIGFNFKFYVMKSVLSMGLIMVVLKIFLFLTVVPVLFNDLF